MGRPPGAVPLHPNLVLAACLARPGEDPGGTAVRLLTSVRRRGYPAGFLGADAVISQAHPERFHLPARALGYSLVMDYKETELGRQANSGGAAMVDGAFFCLPCPRIWSPPAGPAGRDHRHQRPMRPASQPGSWRLVRKQGPTKTATSDTAVRPEVSTPPVLPAAAGCSRESSRQIPVLAPPLDPPKVCTQSAVTIAPTWGPGTVRISLRVTAMGPRLRHLPQHHRGQPTVT